VDHSAPLSGPDGDPTAAALAARWKRVIVGLVREVVSSVDPNVRKGDGLDIRPYVKLKIIPGGSVGECVYVDGVVFRKTVSHKKMMEDVENAVGAGVGAGADVGAAGGNGGAPSPTHATDAPAPSPTPAPAAAPSPHAPSAYSDYFHSSRPRAHYYPVLTALSQETPPAPTPLPPPEKTKSTNPRILLLAGGIDFQRTDARLSSLDTLVEQGTCVPAHPPSHSRQLLTPHPSPPLPLDCLCVRPLYVWPH